MSLKDWQEVIDSRFPAVGPITEETRRQIVRESFALRGSVRLTMGRVWTDREYEKRRSKVLGSPLP
jgi:hypothetical protein